MHRYNERGWGFDYLDRRAAFVGQLEHVKRPRMLRVDMRTHMTTSEWGIANSSRGPGISTGVPGFF
jgi:hypothetical protein